MKPQITCFCKSKRSNIHSAITRGSKCRCFTKGKKHKGVTTVDIHKVKSEIVLTNKSKFFYTLHGKDNA